MIRNVMQIDKELLCTLQSRADSCESLARAIHIQSLELSVAQSQYETALLAKILLDERAANETPD